MIFILLFSLILILLESTFLDFPLTLLLVSFSSLVFADFKKLFLLSFLLGIFYDLLDGSLVGQSSLLFLIISLIAFLYRKKFVVIHLAFGTIFFSFSYGAWQLVNREDFNWLKLLIVVMIGMLAIFWARRLGLVKGRREEELMVE